jgi:hypothetical protein
LSAKVAKFSGLGWADPGVGNMEDGSGVAG